jgi:iron complex outermembrane recepter protein
MRRAPVVLAIVLGFVSTRAEAQEYPPKKEEEDVVQVRARPPARSASDHVVDATEIENAPVVSSLDAIQLVPGVVVSDRGLPGRAPRLSLRGFEGTSGQDVELWAGPIPLNQVSHLRAPGYADMRLLMPEVIKEIQLQNGPYDPRQGDSAIAGTMRTTLGLERPGFWGKGSVGSFGSRRVFLAFAPEASHEERSDTFAAFASDTTDGPGGTRAGERSSFVGQFAEQGRNVVFRGTVALGAARFGFPGYLPQADVEREAYAFGAANGRVGRDRTTQALIGGDVVFSVGEGTLGIAGFAGSTKTSFRQDLAAWVSENGALVPDDREQVNDASMAGVNAFFRHGIPLVSKRDAVEVGGGARLDTIEQRDTRLLVDGTKLTTLSDATIQAMDITGYADGSFYPVSRVVVRGGTRLDALSYAVQDRVRNEGVERTSQGFNLGNKGVIDVATGRGVHVVGGYGEGFRSPQARELAEGERTPFVKVRSTELGLRFKAGRTLFASAAAFGSWLSQERVFDAATRGTAPAPPSRRLGATGSAVVREGPFGSSFAITYTDARFTDSNTVFVEGTRVPYAPAFVLREDAFVTGRITSFAGRAVRGRIGVGMEGFAARPLPTGASGKNLLLLDAVAAVGWRELELSVNATNLLGVRAYDTQLVYATNPNASPAPPPPSVNVLVTAPTAVFLTLQIHLRGAEGRKREKCGEDEGVCAD